VVAEFGGDEGVKVVAVEVGFGGFSEVFLVVGGAVVADIAAGEELHFFEDAVFDGAVVGGDDFLFIEAEDLVVIGVGEFVKDDGGVLEKLVAGEKLSGAGDVDFLGEAGIVAAVFEPAGAGMVLHGGEFGVFVFDPNFHLFHFLQRFLWKKDGNSLEVIG